MVIRSIHIQSIETPLLLFNQLVDTESKTFGGKTLLTRAYDLGDPAILKNIRQCVQYVCF